MIEANVMKRRGYGSGVTLENVIWLDTCQHDGHADVQGRADEKRSQNAQGQVAFGVLALLGGRGYGIEPDVTEENNGTSGQHALKAIGHERVPIHRLNVFGGEYDEEKDGQELDAYHDAVDFGGFANTDHQQDGQERDNQEAYKIKMRHPACCR